MNGKIFLKKLSAVFLSIAMLGSVAVADFAESFNITANAYERVDGYPDFDPDIYMANMMTTPDYDGPASYEYLEFKLNQESPATILANRIQNDSTLMANLAEWKLLTFSPKDGVHETMDESDYYEEIILSALKLHTSSSYVKKYLDNKYEKEAKSLFKNMKNILKTSYGSEYLIDDLSSEAMQKINADDLNKCFEKAFKESFPNMNTLGSGIKKFSTFVDVGKNLEQTINNWVAYYECVEMEESLKQLVADLYANCDSSNSALKLALSKINSACQSYQMSATVSVFDTSSKAFLLIFDEVFDLLYAEVIAANPVLLALGVAVGVGQAVGQGVADFLCNASAIVDQNYNLISFSEFEALVKTVTWKYIDNYRKNPTNANANKLFSAVDVLYNNYNDGCDAARKLYDLIYKDNKFTYLLGIVDSSVGEEYEKAKKSLENLKNLNNQSHNDVRENHYYWGLQNDYPEIYQSLVNNGEYIDSSTIIATGKCGDNVNYTLCNNGVLVISGSGDMYDYSTFYYKYSPFYKNENIKKIFINNGVTSIGSCIFENCKNLTEIIIANSVKSIGFTAFKCCYNLTNINIPSSVTYIDDAFIDCTSLEDITIPNSVTCVKSQAFWNTAWYYNQPNGVVYAGKVLYQYKGTMQENTSITIPYGIVSISDYAFAGCNNLTHITLPDSLTHIGFETFLDCGLKSIIIPNSVTCIESDAFLSCENLTSVTISKSTISIGDCAFGGCKNIKDVYYSGTEEEWKKINIGDYNEELLNATVHYNYQYSNSNELKNLSEISADKIELGSTVNVTAKAEGGDGNYTYAILYKKKSDTKWVTVQNFNTNTTKTFKPAYATDYDVCVKVKDGTGTIKKEFFTVSVSDNSSIVESGKCGDNVIYELDSNGTLTISGSGNMYDYLLDGFLKSDVLNVKTGIVGNGITSIGDCIFYGCKNLINVKISDSVKRIGNCAFGDCVNLTDISIPYNVTHIGACSFSGCTNLESIIIPQNVMYIGNNAFSFCTNLKNITIPQSVTHIGEETLGYCENLKDVYYEGTKEEFSNIDIERNNKELFNATIHYNYQYPDSNELKNNSAISADKIVLGSKVNVTAKAEGGDGNYTYAILYKKKSDTKWVTVQNFDTNATKTFKPAYATDYDVCVKVKDSSGKIVKKYFEIKVNDKLKNTSTISATEINKGDTIKVTGSATGGISGYQYQILYKQTAQSKWTMVQDFKDNANATFKPAKITTYDICIKVKDTTGTVDKKYFTVTVKDDPLKNTSTISATTIQKGESVTVTGSATGGAGNYTYAFYYKQKSQSKWTTKQDFNENSVVSIKPAQATTYDVCVKVKDKNGTVEKQYFDVTVNQVVTYNVSIKYLDTISLAQYLSKPLNKCGYDIADTKIVNIANSAESTIEGLKVGTTIMQAHDGVSLKVFNISVIPNDMPPEITPATKKLKLKVGETGTFTCKPRNGIDGTVTYSTYNSSICTISQKGTVKAYQVGYGTVAARLSDGQIITCTVEVTK